MASSPKTIGDLKLKAKYNLKYDDQTDGKCLIFPSPSLGSNTVTTIRSSSKGGNHKSDTASQTVKYFRKPIYNPSNSTTPTAFKRPAEPSKIDKAQQKSTSQATESNAKATPWSSNAGPKSKNVLKKKKKDDGEKLEEIKPCQQVDLSEIYVGFNEFLYPCKQGPNPCCNQCPLHTSINETNDDNDEAMQKDCEKFVYRDVYQGFNEELAEFFDGPRPPCITLQVAKAQGTQTNSPIPIAGGSMLPPPPPQNPAVLKPRHMRSSKGRCPRSDKGGDKPYCDAVPRGLCCPDYSDSYCETYNNNPLGPLPDNWAESIRRSCCASVKPRVPTLSCSPADVSINPPYCQCQKQNELDYDKVYVGFNEDMYSNPPDPCCVEMPKKPWCCGRIPCN